MVEILIFSENTLDFAYNENIGAYAHSKNQSPYSFDTEEEYHILWDGVEYVCSPVAFTYPDGSNCVAVGNALAWGGESTGEPFAVVCDTTHSIMYFLSMETTASHTVKIYQVVEGEEPETPPEEEPTPEGIVLKDRNGNDVEYYGIETVTFDTTTEGKQQTFTKGVAVEGLEIVPDFSGGDMDVNAPDGTLVKSAVIKMPDDLTPENVRRGKEIGGISGAFIGDTEESTVELSMSGGDMVIEPSEAGKVLSKVTVQKPETLIPENIAKDVDISGIIGTFAGGGFKFASGTISEVASTHLTIPHNLGVVPDMVFVYGKPALAQNYIVTTCGFSKAFVDKTGDTLMMSRWWASYNSSYQGVITADVTNCIDSTASGSNGSIYNANADTFSICIANGWKLNSGACWIAIGGLT